MKPLREFIKRKLESDYLKNLQLRINGDLELEEELLDFCTSESCELLILDCQPLSVDFFVQVYNAFKEKRSIAIEPSRKVAGFIDQGALMDLVQALQLKRKRNSSNYGLKALSEHDAVSIRTKHHVGSENVHVRIQSVNREETENDDSDDEEEEDVESGDSDEDSDEDEFHDEEIVGDCNCGDEEDEDGNSEGNYDCKLAKLSRDNWKEEDCENCRGCEFCSGYACLKCDYTVRCYYCGDY